MHLSAFHPATRKSVKINDATEAVQFCTGTDAAINGIVGRLIQTLIAKRQLTAHEVSTLFDYDVIAED